MIVGEYPSSFSMIITGIIGIGCLAQSLNGNNLGHRFSGCRSDGTILDAFHPLFTDSECFRDLSIKY